MQKGTLITCCANICHVGIDCRSFVHTFVNKINHSTGIKLLASLIRIVSDGYNIP